MRFHKHFVTPEDQIFLHKYHKRYYDTDNVFSITGCPLYKENIAIYRDCFDSITNLEWFKEFDKFGFDGISPGLLDYSLLRRG